jgi:hypothetical protein
MSVVRHIRKGNSHLVLEPLWILGLAMFVMLNCAWAALRERLHGMHGFSQANADFGLGRCNIDFDKPSERWRQPTRQLQRLATPGVGRVGCFVWSRTLAGRVSPWFKLQCVTAGHRKRCVFQLVDFRKRACFHGAAGWVAG